MTVKSFGCSFIFGSDLKDTQQEQHKFCASQLTWCSRLARSLNQDYECYAYPGSGNLQIVERLLNQIPLCTSEDLIVIGWTWIDRFDYYDCNYDPQEKLTPWATVMPVDSNDVAKVYYKNLHSEYQDKFSSLAYIKLAIDTLRQHNLAFVMTYMDELLFDQRWHTSAAVLNMQEYILPFMTKFEGMTFLEWSKQKGFPISETLHPLEPAHQAGFELLKSYNLV